METKKIKNMIKSKTKSKTRRVENKNIKLLELFNINEQQKMELLDITMNKDTMKYIGKGNIWTLNDINTYIEDEIMENKLPHNKRKYYSFVLLKNDNVIGFISGRKTLKLLPKHHSPFDLLLRMFISHTEINKGYGKLILKLFIEKYYKYFNNIDINKQNVKNMKNIKICLISDIDKKNIPSIKIHISNNFKYVTTYKYPNNKKYLRYIYTYNMQLSQ